MSDETCEARLRTLIDLCLGDYEYDEERVEVVMAGARKASEGGSAEEILVEGESHRWPHPWS